MILMSSCDACPETWNESTLLFNDVRASLVEMTDQAADVFLVSGNDAGGKDNGVAFVDLHAFVCGGRHVPKRGAILTLRSVTR
jgi:hypothetical protein